MACIASRCCLLNTLRRYLVTKTRCTCKANTQCRPCRRSESVFRGRSIHFPFNEFQGSTILSPMETVKTLKLRIRDRHAKAMLAMARDVNTVWNFANETQYRSLKRYCNRPRVWLSGFELQKLTAGVS